MNKTFGPLPHGGQDRQRGRQADGAGIVHQERGGGADGVARQKVDEVSRVKKELEATREAIAKAEREYDLNRAADVLLYGDDERL